MTEWFSGDRVNDALRERVGPAQAQLAMALASQECSQKSLLARVGDEAVVADEVARE